MPRKKVFKNILEMAELKKKESKATDRERGAWQGS